MSKGQHASFHLHSLLFNFLFKIRGGGGRTKIDTFRCMSSLHTVFPSIYVSLADLAYSKPCCEMRCEIVPEILAAFFERAILSRLCSDAFCVSRLSVQKSFSAFLLVDG